jgi:hypothetical protein
MITIKLSNGGKLEESFFGTKYYYLNNKLHREDGAAIEWSSGYKQWWINDELLPCTSQKQFEQLMRLKLFW